VPIRSPISSTGLKRRLPDLLPACNRSRMTSDFDILRSRDSASISATRRSGRRTVRVFTERLYYGPANAAIRRQLRECHGMLEVPLH